MKATSFPTFCCCLVVLTAGLWTTAVRGALISYEGFNYASGDTLNTKNPGAGWNSAWSGATASTVVSSSLLYPAGTGFTTTGNSISSPGGLGGSIQYATGFQFSMTSDTVRYASYLASKPTAGNGNEFLQMNLGTGGGTSWLFGISSSEGFLLRSSNLGTETDIQSTGGLAQLDTTYLLVSKLVTSSTGNDMLYMNWYSPLDTVPATEPLTWMLSLSVNNTTTNTQNLLQLSSGSSTGTYRADEIRLGTTWQDVASVPEPSRALLLLLGTFAMLTWRRRN